MFDKYHEKAFDEELEETDQFLAIEDVQSKVRPEITLLVDNRPIVFLCDSGAEKTVMRDVKWLTKSKNHIRVKSANGIVKTQYMSMPITLQLPVEEMVAVTIPVVMSPDCPHNLLGREAMTALELAIIPTDQGTLTVTRLPLQPSETCVVLGPDQPHYYWTLDLKTKGPTSIAEELCNLATERTPPYSQKMEPDDLHVTLRFKYSPGPDNIYDTIVHKLGPQYIRLPHLYWKGKTCLALVTVTEEVEGLLSSSRVPHISLTKPQYMNWQDLHDEAKLVQHTTDWQSTSEVGVEYSKNTRYFRQKLGWSTTATPATHMTDQV